LKGRKPFATGRFSSAFSPSQCCRGLRSPGLLPGVRPSASDVICAGAVIRASVDYSPYRPEGVGRASCSASSKADTRATRSATRESCPGQDRKVERENGASHPFPKGEAQVNRNTARAPGVTYPGQRRQRARDIRLSEGRA